MKLIRRVTFGCAVAVLTIGLLYFSNDSLRVSAEVVPVATTTEVFTISSSDLAALVQAISNLTTYLRDNNRTVLTSTPSTNYESLKKELAQELRYTSSRTAENLTAGVRNSLSTSITNLQEGGNLTNPTMVDPTISGTLTGPNYVFTSVGSLGIGSSSPFEKLEVLGNIYATGNVYAGANKDIAVTKSTVARTIYVDASSGNDSTGTGSSSAPYKTIMRALQDVPDVMQHSYTIQLSPGVYREYVNIRKLGTLSGDAAGAANTLTIQGDTLNPNSYRITGADASADTTAVRLFGVFINTPGIMTKIAGVRIDYATAYAVAVQSTWGRFASVNISNTPNGILTDDSSILDFRSGGTINITGNSGASGFGIVFQKKATMWATGATVNISTFSQGIRSFDGGVSGYGGTFNISNPSKIAGTFGVQLIQSDGIHDTVMNITNMDIGVGVYNSSYLDLDSTSSFTNVNTAVDASISAGLDMDLVTFSSVTTKYNVQYNSVVDARDDITTGKIITSVSGASPIANGASAVAFDFDTVNTLSTAGAKLFSVKNAGAEKFTVDRNGNVGIGSSTPNSLLTVAGSVSFTSLSNSAGTAYLCITSATGAVSTSSTACAPSSLRFKDNVANLDASRGLDVVKRLRPVSYLYKPELLISGPQIGFIAEEVATLVPEVVGVDGEGKPANIDYAKLTPVIVKAIQELDTRINNLAISSTTTTVTDSSSFAENLAYVGGQIVSNVIHFAELVVDNITAKFIATDKLQVNEGITIKDEDTGEYVCVKAKSGLLVTLPGACSTQEPTVVEVGSSTMPVLEVEISTTTPPVEQPVSTTTPSEVGTTTSSQ